jgi:hypothetical protein
VSGLDLADLREEHSNEGGPFRGHPDTVQ